MISRGPKSSMRTKVTKRRGRRCSLRRYEFVFPSLNGDPWRQIDRGFAFADHELAINLQPLGRRKRPFYALVAQPLSARPQIVEIVASDDVPLIVRRARRAREDAEWEAAAPEANPRSA